MRNLLLAMTLSLTVTCLALPALAGPAPSDAAPWWKDSVIVRALALSDIQIKVIEKAVLNHLAALGNLGTDLERQEAALTSLVDSPGFEEKRAAAQIDQVVAARGKLEKERTMMMLEIRRAVSHDQWKKLQELQRSETPSTPARPPGESKTNAKAQADKIGAEEPTYLIRGPVKPPVPPLNPPSSPIYLGTISSPTSGYVVLQAFIDKYGLAHTSTITRTTDTSLDLMSMDRVLERLRFQPATLEGRPVSVVATIELWYHGGKWEISSVR